MQHVNVEQGATPAKVSAWWAPVLPAVSITAFVVTGFVIKQLSRGIDAGAVVILLLSACLAAPFIFIILYALVGLWQVIFGQPSPKPLPKPDIATRPDRLEALRAENAAKLADLRR